MKRFRFKLQPLLRVRRHEEQQKQHALAAVLRQQQELEAQLRLQQSLISQNRQALRGRLQGRLNVEDLRSQAASTMHAQRTAQHLLMELAAIHRQLEGARTELVEATRRRRAIELIRQSQFDQWKKEQAKQDDAFMDELATSRAARESAP